MEEGVRLDVDGAALAVLPAIHSMRSTERPRLVSCIIIATTIFRRAMWSVLSPCVPAAATPKSYTRAARLDGVPWQSRMSSAEAGWS
jgi:hypothetical protein